MGTRAVIRFKGKPLVATHWDGDPDSLGQDLVRASPRNKNQVLKVAKKHSIDFADSSVIGKLQPKTLIVNRNGIVEDKTITDFNEYGDFAEYEYDVDEKGNVKYRKLPFGTYDTTKKTAPFKSLKRKLKDVS